MVNFDPSRTGDARQRLDEAWAKLSQGGTPLMPLGAYPFSERYGWIQDKYGLSWQLILTNPAGQPRPWIIPSAALRRRALRPGRGGGRVLSLGVQERRAGDDRALRREPGRRTRRGPSCSPTSGSRTSGWRRWTARTSTRFTFNEAVSFIVSCDTQQEIDFYWEKLSAHPEAEQCGWLKDKYGALVADRAGGAWAG